VVNLEVTNEEILKEATEYLVSQNTGFLATSGSAGLRVSPVTIFLNDETNIFMHCYGGDKMTNLRENSEACLLVIEENLALEPGLYQGVQVFGEAKEIPQESETYQKAEIWCPYTHKNQMTMLEFRPKSMVVVDYPEGEKRKRSLELELKEGQ